MYYYGRGARTISRKSSAAPAELSPHVLAMRTASIQLVSHADSIGQSEWPQLKVAVSPNTASLRFTFVLAL